MHFFKAQGQGYEEFDPVEADGETKNDHQISGSEKFKPPSASHLKIHKTFSNDDNRIYSNTSSGRD